MIGVIAFVAFIAASVLEEQFKSEISAESNVKSMFAILAQMLIVGSLASVVLDMTVDAGWDLLPLSMFAMAMVVLGAKLIDLFKTLDKIEELEGNIPL